MDNDLTLSNLSHNHSPLVHNDRNSQTSSLRQKNIKMLDNGVCKYFACLQIKPPVFDVQQAIFTN